MIKQNEKMISLTEDHIYFGGMHLSYRLLITVGERFHLYRIRAEFGEEFDEVEVGSDLSQAMFCYQSVVRGGVTPCTLEEVVRDLKYA